MFKPGDKIECIEEHSWTKTDGEGNKVKTILVPVGYHGVVHDVQNCSGCGVQYVYLGFHHDTKSIHCSVCKGSIKNEGKTVWSRCTRFRKLDEASVKGIVEFKSITLEPVKIITPERVQEISAN